jgi:hypothetical protein
MDLWRITAWVIAFTLPPLSLQADNLTDGLAFCQAPQASGAPICHLQTCPCAPGEVSLKRFEDNSGAPALCACSTPQASRHQTRQKAVKACEEYRRTQRQSCFISRADCPRGFETLAEFSDETGNRFTACRDNRNKQPRRVVAGLPQEQQLVQYQLLIDSLESKRQGSPRSLPQATIQALNNYFHGVSLSSLSLVNTHALSKGCFSDCERIFCADEGQIAAWTDPEKPLISHLLLHQIAHGERCEREGGRDRFVSNWFRHLPDDVYQKLLAGEPIDAERIHFAMYMESHADLRAEGLCRRLPGCRME